MTETHTVDLTGRFDARAETYDASKVHRWQARMAADLTAATAHDRVLDVATGTGLVLRYLPAASDLGQRIGVDNSAGMLETARRALPTATFVVADAADVPFEPGRFDAVTCAAAIPYLIDRGRPGEAGAATPAPRPPPVARRGTPA